MGAEMIILEPLRHVGHGDASESRSSLSLSISPSREQPCCGLAGGGRDCPGLHRGAHDEVAILAWDCAVAGTGANQALLDFSARLTAAVLGMTAVVWITMAYPVLPREARSWNDSAQDKSRLVAALAIEGPGSPFGAPSRRDAGGDTARLAGSMHPSTPAELKEALATDLNRLLQAGPSTTTRFADASLEEDLVRSRQPTGDNWCASTGVCWMDRQSAPADARRAGPLYRAEDLTPARFIATLNAGSPVSRHLRDSLSPDAPPGRGLSTASSPRAVQNAIVAQLNETRASASTTSSASQASISPRRRGS